MIKRVLRYWALARGKGGPLYRKLCKPGGREWAEYLRLHGRFYRFGEGCSILPSAVFTDPELTSIGSRVCMGTCTIICHDGSIEMLEHAYGVKLDRVGAVVLEDDVYIGQQALIVGTDKLIIGAGSIIGAGAVVRSNVPPGSIVAGNPAKVVGKVHDLIRFWEADFLEMPWKNLILGREGAYDPAIERQLVTMRQQ